MTFRRPSFVALVMLFAALVAGVIWWQALRSQAQLREQVLLQAEQRSLHLADAMAGQVQAQLNLMDVSLKRLREHWTREPHERFDALAREVLASLPPGLASHVSVADARGYLAYNSLDMGGAVFVGDRPHFQTLRDGPDSLQVSMPVRSRLTGEWVFLVGRPLLLTNFKRRSMRFQFLLINACGSKQQQTMFLPNDFPCTCRWKI